jgi:iron complex outermembrane recepter protein
LITTKTVHVKSLLVSALLGLAAMSSGLAQAQTAPAAKDASDTSNLEQIVVTGTRRVDRTVTDSASPIDVISATEIAEQPTANMLETVRNIVPSFFVGQNSISDASTFVRAPSLRGLPGDETLVMINGKRFNRSALVQVYTGGDTGLSFGSHGSDISSIPSLALSRLEVLRDGATAQYGSDAIAGVLNYGLREDAGFEVNARYGQYQDHGDGKSYQIAANWGAKFAKGFINLTGEYDDDGQTSRGKTRPIAYQFALENPSLANTLPHYPLPAQIWGNSPSHGYKFVLNSGIDVTDSSKLYFFGNFAFNHADESFNFRSSYGGQANPNACHNFTDTNGVVECAGGRSFFQAPYYLTPCPTGNATCLPGGYVQDANVFWLGTLYPGGFTPRFVGETKESYGVFGYKGTAGGLRYDLSGTLSRNALNLSMYNSISPSFGKDSQTSFKFGELIQKETDANLDLSYDINAGLASPLTLSGGLESRRETYEATAADPQSYGGGAYSVAHELYAQTAPGSGVFIDTDTTTAVYGPGASGYAGTLPIFVGSHSQSSYAGYLDLEGDLTSRFSAGAAARYEHYDSAGGSSVYKLNGIFKITDGVKIRATLGSGFHAASPGQDNTQVVTTSFVGATSIQQGTFPVTSAVAQFKGAVPLKPEYSNNYGLGLVFNPSADYTVTLDWYSIKVRDRIILSESFTVSALDILNATDPALHEQLVTVGEGGTVQYFTNSMSTRTQGLDVVSSWHTRVADGALNVTLAYNYNETKVTKYNPLQTTYDQVITAERLAPNHRANLQATWSKGPWSLGAVEHFYGSWRDETDYPSGDTPFRLGQLFGAKFTTDFNASYEFANHLTATVGGSNILNAYPDKLRGDTATPIYPITGGADNGMVYPRNGGPFGFNGAFWYARLHLKF